jgi:hypothetical protein
MESFTYGSAEGFEALKRGLMEHSGNEHQFTLPPDQRGQMADALETAYLAGHDFGERYTGINWTEAALWPEYFAEMNLDDEQMIWLVDALYAAFQLGDDYAGDWLSCLCVVVDVEWV